MSEVFGRKYEIYIGLPTELIYKHTTPVTDISTPPALIQEMNLKTPKLGVGGLSSLTGGYIDYVTIPKKVIKLSSDDLNPLQFTADISYNKNPAGGKAAPAKIKLYNLNKETISYAQKDASVIIKAGYVQDKVLPMLYVGQIITSKTSRENDNGDIVTEIVCGDAIVPMKMVKFSGKYTENTTHNKMIGDVMDTFAANGVPKGIYKATNISYYENKSPRSFVGTAASVLDTLCKEINYVWYVTKGKLNVVPKSAPRLGKLIEIKESQIIGKVELSTDNASTTSNSPDATTGGVKFKVFLDGEIDNTYDVRILGGDLKGDYSVDSVTFKLDYYGTDWYSEIEASTGRSE